MKRFEKTAAAAFTAVLIFALSGCGDASELSALSSDSEVKHLDHMEIWEISEKNGHTELLVAENCDSEFEPVWLNMDGREELAQALEKYKDWFWLNADYDDTLGEYCVINEDFENLGQLDAEGLFNAFDPERFETADVDADVEYKGGDISLSELKEKVTYHYSFKTGVEAENPAVINDTGSIVLISATDAENHSIRNCDLFPRRYDDSPSGTGFRDLTGKEVTFYYECISNDEYFKKLPDDNVVKLSSIGKGNTFSLRRQFCIWNDTESNLTVTDNEGRQIQLAAGEAVPTLAEQQFGTEFSVQ